MNVILLYSTKENDVTKTLHDDVTEIQSTGEIHDGLWSVYQSA